MSQLRATFEENKISQLRGTAGRAAEPLHDAFLSRGSLLVSR